MSNESTEPTPTTNGPLAANLGDRAGVTLTEAERATEPLLLQSMRRLVDRGVAREVRVVGGSGTTVSGYVTEHDEHIESLIAARVDAALAPVRELAEMWAREANERGPGDRIYTSGVASMLAAALDRKEDHR